MRFRTVLVTALVLLGSVTGGPSSADDVTVVADPLLGGSVVETWGACEVPGGWLVVDHDGWAERVGDAGMRLFQGSDATAVVARKWARTNPTSGQTIDRHHCVTADFDHNGLYDLYVTAGRGATDPIKDGRPNELWLQTKPGVFRNRAAQWGVQEVCGRSHFAATADFNGDGWADIYVGNATPKEELVDDPCDATPGSETSHLYLNNAGVGFTDSTAAWGLSGSGGVHCAQAGQFVGTKAPDLIVCRDEGLAVYRNTGSALVDRRRRLGIPSTNWRNAAAGDVDADGVVDLVTATTNDVNLWPHFTGPATRLYTGDSVHRVRVNPQGDVYILRSNPYTSLTNPTDLIMLREPGGWSTVTVPDAAGVGDFVIWLEAAKAWLVGNGSSDRRGPLQLVRVMVTPPEPTECAPC